MTSVQSHLEFLLKESTIKSVKKYIRKKLINLVKHFEICIKLRRCDESTKLLSKKHRSKGKPI